MQNIENSYRSHLEVELVTLLSPDLVAWWGCHLQLRVQALCWDPTRPLLQKREIEIYHNFDHVCKSTPARKILILILFGPADHLCVDERGNASSESVLSCLVQGLKCYISHFEGRVIIFRQITITLSMPSIYDKLSPESYRWKFVCLSKSPPRPASASETWMAILTSDMMIIDQGGWH